MKTLLAIKITGISSAVLLFLSCIFHAPITEKSDPGSTRYTVTYKGCSVSLITFKTGVNQDTLQYKSSGCGDFSPEDEAHIFARLLGTIAKKEKLHFRSLAWGRLHPDDRKTSDYAARLASAALKHSQWPHVLKQNSSAKLHEFVIQQLNEAGVFSELVKVFQGQGKKLSVSSVEKVLIQKVKDLPFKVEGSKPTDKVPSDAQVWFRVEF